MRARYETLDAYRGVAASTVVIYHLHVMGWPFDLVPHGYLAVDFFFMLSGFVLGLRYSGPLRDGMGLGAFAALRFRRIYPLALTGSLLGACVWLCIWAVRPWYTDGLPSLLTAFALNAVLLPDLASGPVANRALFPENGALWSLFFELVANFVWAAVGAKLSSRALAVVLVVSGTLFGLSIVQHGTANLGWGAQNALAGLVRVCFGFTAGLLIHRVHLRMPPLKLPAPSSFGSLMLIIVVAAPFGAGLDALPWWDIASVFVGLPVLVMVGGGQGRGGRPGILLGQMSYPLYVVHGPVLMSTLLATGFGAGCVAPTVTAMIAVAASYGAAWIVLRFVDDKLQAWFSKSIHRAARATRTERL